MRLRRLASYRSEEKNVTDPWAYPFPQRQIGLSNHGGGKGRG